MKTILSDVSSFPLLYPKYLYVDKTDYVYKMLEHGRHYFLARPRRFGKSLPLSTLASVFSGNKELFRGFAIYDSDYDRMPYPVVSLTFNRYNRVSYGTPEKTELFLQETLDLQSQLADVKLTQASSSKMLADYIIKMRKSYGTDVVVLIDEYDKILLDNLGQPDLADIIDVMKGFYSVLKELFGIIRFTFVTGVSRFSMVSMASSLNHLKNISEDIEYATMLGYTQEELQTNFAEKITDFAKQLGCTEEEMCARIKYRYDGYSFHKKEQNIYNPYTCANFFAQSRNVKFKNYWFESGTPSFIFNLIRKNGYDLRNITTKEFNDTLFSAMEAHRIPLANLMYRTGYITLKSYTGTGYRVDFPNKEVEEAFNSLLVTEFLNVQSEDVHAFDIHVRKAMRDGDPVEMGRAMKVFFAGVNYQKTKLGHADFQAVFVSLFRFLGFDVRPEDPTDRGRIDVSILQDKAVYIIEIKTDSNNTALRQIETKKYCEKYQLGDRKVYAIGANFSSDTGRLLNWAVAEADGGNTVLPVEVISAE